MRNRIKILIEREYGDFHGAQKAFAKKLKISESTVSAWLLGTREISMEGLDKIVEVFGVNRRWLLTGEGSPNAPNPPKPLTDRQLLERTQAQLEQSERMYAALLDKVSAVLSECSKRMETAGKVGANH